MNSTQQAIADRKIDDYFKVLRYNLYTEVGLIVENDFMAKYYDGFQTPYEEFRATIFRRAQAVYKCEPKDLTLEQLRQIGGDL